MRFRASLRAAGPLTALGLAVLLAGCGPDERAAGSRAADPGASAVPTPSVTPTDEAHFVDPDCRFQLLHVEASIRDYNDAGAELRRSDREDADYLRYYRELKRASERLARYEVVADLERGRDALAGIYLAIGVAYRDATLATSQEAFDAASSRIDATSERLEVIFDRLFVRPGYRCGDSEP